MGSNYFGELRDEISIDGIITFRSKYTELYPILKKLLSRQISQRPTAEQAYIEFNNLYNELSAIYNFQP